MVAFYSAACGGETASAAIGGALRDALDRAEGVAVKLAVVFVSADLPGLDDVGEALEPLGDTPVVGGISSGTVFALEPGTVPLRGASVALIGGEGIEVSSRVAETVSPSLVELVPEAAALADDATKAARRGLGHFTTLVFGPSLVVDGEAVVAAVRKGAGVRSNLAGCLTGDDSYRPAKIFCARRLCDRRVSVTGLFSEKPIGVAARHGWHAVGPARTVTRADGARLLEIDKRPALDVWLEDARAAGGAPPDEPTKLSPYLTHHFPIGIDDERFTRDRGTDPLAVRAPYAIGDDGSVLLSGSIAEGCSVRLVGSRGGDLLRASRECAEAAVARAGGNVAGALVLSCASRAIALGDAFEGEPRSIHEVARAPIAGGCVYGEIARTARDENAFFNTTTVVVAFPK